MAEILAAIPAYNEEKSIGSVVLAARVHADEVAVVDDGSTDRTAWIAEQAGATVIRHSANMGYGAAVQTCFSYARTNGTKVLVLLDGDGQHRPDHIPDVVAPVKNGLADIVIGSRFLKPEHEEKVPRYRRFGIRVLTKLTNLGTRGKQKVKDGQSGFRAYSRLALDRIAPLEMDMGVSAEILWEATKWGLTVMEVPIRVDYDVEGSTKNPVRHAMSVIGSMVRYVETEHALLTFGLPGLLLFLLGLVLGIKVVNDYYGTSPRELAFGSALLTVMLMTFGLLLSFTGLILHAVINANRRSR